MSPSEINQVIDVARDIWGKFDPNPEVVNIWYIALSKFSAADAIRAVRSHAAESKFMPKPVEIAYRCISELKSKSDAPASESSGYDEEALAKEIEADRSETDAILADLTEDEYDRHCRSASRDWRMTWLTTTNSWRSRIGRSVVACRIEAGLGPDDDDTDNPPPPRNNVKPGNLAIIPTMDDEW